MLKSDFRDYVETVKEFYTNSNLNNSKIEVKESTKSTNSVIDKNVFNNVLTKMIDKPAIDLKDLDFLSSYITKQKSKMMSKLKVDTKMLPQKLKQNKPLNNQQNCQPSTQPQIPSLLSQPVYFQPNLMQQATNFMPNNVNQNHQIQSLMSISNPVQVVQQQVPSLMNIQTNFNRGNHKNTKNYSNYK